MTGRRKKPPFFAKRLLEHMIDETVRYQAMGDFEEQFNTMCREKGTLLAHVMYWRQILAVLPSFLYSIIYWSSVMIHNYLKIALRNVKRHTGYSFINISGLAIGMTCCVLILLLVKEELSFDRFHENADDIYRVLQDIQFSDHTTTWAITQGPLGPALEDEIPEIINSARIKRASFRLKYEEKYFLEEGVLADPAILEMYTFPLIKGPPETVLDEPNSIVISERMAEKYFGEGIEPIGKVVNVGTQYDFTVTGIMKNVPANSHLQFDFIAPFVFGRQLGYTVDIWSNSTFTTYIQLQRDISREDIVKKLHGFLDEKPTIEENAQLNLQPLTKIRLHSDYEYDGFGSNAIVYVYILSIVAFFILLIACINFMNLNTARYMNRAREVGLRKVVGAKRSELIQQFFGESILLSILALILTILTVYIILPSFNTFFEKQLPFNPSNDLQLLTGLIIITLLTGIISGSYPALLLSSFKPVSVIQGTCGSGTTHSHFRKILVVFQYILSILLIICTMVVYKQLSFMRDAPLGFQKNNIVTIPMSVDMLPEYDVIKEKLLEHANITYVTAVSNLPTNGYSFSNSLWDWDGKNPDDEILFRAVLVHYDYFKTFNIDIIQGRAFSTEFPGDINNTCIINQTAAQVMNMDSPVGQRLSNSGRNSTIIGVVKDYNFRSLHFSIEPLILILYPDELSRICMAISPENSPGTIRYIESIWKDFNSDRPFEYTFLNEDIDVLYTMENKLGTLSKYSTFLALFIACLGLFGLASYTAEQRTKEVGIRKVLGASHSGIVLLLSKEFLRLIVYANFIAWPIAYIAMSKWLEGYAYRTDIGWRLFVLSGILGIAIALLTVSYQALRAANSNPVDSLRYE
ncbi:ABC transporter permease [candidate division KSB1 bacterium]